MKRYAGKSSRATKKTPANSKRDPAWYGNPEEHSRAAKRGVRRKKAAKAAASVRGKQGWLTRFQEEAAVLQAKRRPTKKDVERLKELRKKIRDQKALLSRKRPAKKRPIKKRPAVTKRPAVKKRPSVKKKPVKKVLRPPTVRQQAAIDKERAEAKREQARIRRRKLAAERKALAEQEERARLRRERERKKAREAQKEAKRLERERLAAIEAERKERERAQQQELEELRKFKQTELQRRQQATLDASAMLDELKKVYGNRVPPEGEMIGIAQTVDLTVREIYSIWHGSPEVFAA